MMPRFFGPDRLTLEEFAKGDGYVSRGTRADLVVYIRELERAIEQTDRLIANLWRETGLKQGVK